MKERIFTTKEQGRVLVEAGLPISTAIGFRDKHLDPLYSMEDNAGRTGLIETVTPGHIKSCLGCRDVIELTPSRDRGGYTLKCYKFR